MICENSGLNIVW